MGTYLVIKNNFRRNFNHKFVFAFSFLFPFLLCLAAGMVNHIGKSDLRVGVISTGEVSRDEITMLFNNTVEYECEKASRDSVYSDLIMGKYHIVLDYSNPNSGKNPELLSIQNMDKLTAEVQSLTKTERAIAYLMTLFMITAVVQGSVIIRDKSVGTLERYCYSLHNKRSYYVGFFFHNLILTFLQGEIAMLIMMVMDKDWELSFGEGILAAVFIALISVTFAFVICAISKKDMNANISASSIAVILSILGGTFVAVGNMPGLFQIMSLFSPIRWIIQIIQWI